MLTQRDHKLDVQHKGAMDKYIMGDSAMGMLNYNDDHFSQCAQLTVNAVLKSWGLSYEESEPVAAAKGKELKVVPQFIGTNLTADRRLDAAIFSHFWTDQLAGGHVRTPRHALRQLCGGSVGGLMTNGMHNEDNSNGVPVTVALPFRTGAENKDIVLQRQTFRVKGDANYWKIGRASCRERV